MSKETLWAPSQTLCRKQDLSVEIARDSLRHSLHLYAISRHMPKVPKSGNPRIMPTPHCEYLGAHKLLCATHTVTRLNALRPQVLTSSPQVEEAAWFVHLLACSISRKH